MKVCHMTSVHKPEDVRIFHKECTSLAKEYEVYLVESGETYDKNGVHIVGVGDIPTSRLKRMMSGSKMVYEQALKLDCDVYHFHDPELMSSGLKLKKQGKKVIFDIHENVVGSILEKPYLPGIIAKVVSKVYGIYEKRACKKFDALITVTPTQTDYYKAINPKTVEIRNYPFNADSVSGEAKEEKTVVFAGGISPQWNHDVILNALQRIEGAKYILCGAQDSYVEELKRMPGWEKVDYLGRLPHEEVDAVLSKACAGVALLSPGNNTGWEIGTMGNTKIFEVMKAGLPLICTDFVLWKELVEENNCGICVSPRDEDQVEEAMKYIFEHPDEAKQMGENGRAAINEKYNWGNEEEKLYNLYASL